MSDTILGFNAFPKEFLITKDKLIEYYKSKGLNVFVSERDGKIGFK